VESGVVQWVQWDAHALGTNSLEVCAD